MQDDPSLHNERVNSRAAEISGHRRKRKRDHNRHGRPEAGVLKPNADTKETTTEIQLAAEGKVDKNHGEISQDGSLHRLRHKQQDILKAKAQSLAQLRKSLPIWPHQDEIRKCLTQRDILLLVGETGSGKSTQVPQFLVTEAWCKPRKVNIQDQQTTASAKEISVGGCIAITEPRRVAAISLARRVATEMGTPLGSASPASQVGYSVRFDNSTSPNTRVKFLTEGMLLQEMLRDPWLRQYSAVIVDEVHERGVNVDLVAGFLRNLVAGDKKGRGGVPMKVIVMSATADMERLKKFYEEGFGSQPTLVAAPGSVPSTGQSISQNGNKSKNGNDHGNPPSGVLHNDKTALVGEGKVTNGHDNCTLLNSSGQSSSSTLAEEQTRDFQRLYVDQRQPWWVVKGHFVKKYGFNPKISERKFRKQFRLHGTHDSGLESKGPSADAKTHSEETPPGGRDIREQSLVPRLSASIMGNVVTCYIEGRQYPVTVIHTPEPVHDFVDAALHTIFKIHYGEGMPGDILVFLTGQDDIEALEKLIEEYAEAMGSDVPRVLILPLFAALPQHAQQRVFQPAPHPNMRKIILATNIAETSVTVSGVRYVIDCGKAKVKQFRTRLGLDSLLVKPISKSSAQQRKGRAGREAPGKCYRLYTESEYLKLEASAVPEILRCDVTQAALTMKARGVDDIMSFPFLDSPPRESLEKALLQLFSLGALTESGAISDLGQQMAKLPLTPALARVLLAAASPEIDCLIEVIDIISCLSVENLFLNLVNEEKKEQADLVRKDLLRREGDHMTLLNTVQKYISENTDRRKWADQHFVSHRAMQAVMDVRKQLRAQCHQQKLLPPPSELEDSPATTPERAAVILKCFLTAFAPSTARLFPDGSYRTVVGNQTVAIHPTSALFGKKVEAIMYHEYVFTNRSYARWVSAVQMDWIGNALAR